MTAMTNLRRRATAGTRSAAASEGVEGATTAGYRVTMGINGLQCGASSYRREAIFRSLPSLPRHCAEITELGATKK